MIKDYFLRKSRRNCLKQLAFLPGGDKLSKNELAVALKIPAVIKYDH